MKKTFFIRFAESCVFLVLLCAVLVFVSSVVERKKGHVLFSAFLDEPKAYDVLFLGDSRFMNGMMPPDLWADYGVAGYNLSCYGNSMPVTYWTMMNALDYASPRLIVLGINGVDGEKKITGSSADLHTALDFFPLTRTKAQAIEDLMYDPEWPDAVDDEGNRYQDIKWEYYLTLGKYHSRWSELTKEDFVRRKSPGMGGEALIGVVPFGEYELIDDDQYADEAGPGFAYLRKIIEECRSRGIELLLVNMPDPAMLRSQRHALTVGSIAEEYGVDYINLTQLDCVVDYEVDCYDGQPHLNASGTQKMTDYLGSYIAARYDLPDRRQDAAYAHFAQRYSDYVDDKLDVIRAQTELSNVLMLLHDNDYDFRMAIDPDAPLYANDTQILLMHNIAREHVHAGDEYELYSNAMYPLEGFDTALWECLPYALDRTDGILREYVGEDAIGLMQEVFSGEDEASVVIDVIDAKNGSVAVRLRF